MIPVEVVWQRARAGDALVALATAAGLDPRRSDVGPPVEPFVEWLAEVARSIGVELHPSQAFVPHVEEMLRGSAPAIVAVDDGVVALLAIRNDWATVLTPDGDVRRIRVVILFGELCARHVPRAPVTTTIPSQASSALAAAHLRRVRVDGVFSVRLPVEAPVRSVVRSARVIPRLASVAIAHLVVLVCGLGSWWVIGDGALSGTLDDGLLAAWALLLGTAVVVRAGGMWIAGRLVIDVGILLRERLLAGVLRISPDDLRAEGIGLSLGRVFESTVFEQLAITGGFRALFAVLELAMAVVVLAVGAGGWIHVMLLLAVLVVVGMGFRRYFRCRNRWSEERLGLTHGLVESILGAQTRLAQQEPNAPHVHEDRALAAYATRSATMDQALARLQGLVPRGWLLFATSVLAVVLVVDGPTPGSLAIALGGILLTHHALESLIDGSMHLVDAAIAWRALAPLMAAARHAPHAGTPSLAFAPRPSNVPTARMLGVVYHAGNRTDPILTGAELTLKRGEYVRLTGASGSGKSTLAATLAALRTPQAGLVLSGGLDYATLGATGWRRRIACAPDFHDNHLFTGPLGFNLLVERWPPRPEDLAEARAICDELGLGPLIDRMPAGMFEMVGETGWQLSHGERSRIFIARALLQHAELVILDESLGALDPVTLALTIACIEKRAPSALVIAHP